MIATRKIATAKGYRRRAAVLVATSFLLFPAVLVGQKRDGFDPLAPIGMGIACQRAPTAPDVGDIEYTIIDNGAGPANRTTSLAYLRTGEPVMMSIVAPVEVVEPKILHIVMVTFASQRWGARYVLDLNEGVHMPETPESVDNLPPGWERLSDGVLDRAEELAKDFWKRRCPPL